MRAAAWSPAGADGTYTYQTAVVVAFWPESQHQSLISRWPHLADRVGADWDEHRRRIERHCALGERDTGVAVNQVSVDLVGFEAFLARRGVTTPTDDDLSAYPDMRRATARFSAWPPDRTAPAGAARPASTNNAAARTDWALCCKTDTHTALPGLRR